MKKKEKNKIFLYAGVLLATLVFVYMGIATSNQTNTILETINKENGGCNRIYDVNRDSVINFQDAGLCWVYIQNDLGDPYGDLLYDVNMDGTVNFQDAGLIWVNRD